jgi:hypothetical protein
MKELLAKNDALLGELERLRAELNTKSSESEKQLTSLQDRLSAEQEEKQALEDQLDQAKKAHIKHVNNKRTTSGIISVLESQLKEKSDIEQELLAQIERANQEKQQFLLAQEKLTDELKTTSSGSKIELKALRDRLSAEQEEKQALEDQLDQVEKIHVKQANNKRTNSGTISVLESQLKEKSDIEQELLAQIERANQEKQQFSLAQEALMTEIKSKAAASVEEAENKVKDIKLLLEESNSGRSNNAVLIENLDKTLEKTRKTYDTLIGRYQTSITGLESKFNAVTASYKNTLAQEQKLRDEMEIQRESLLRHQIDLNMKNEIIDKAEREILLLKTAKVDAERQLKIAMSDVQSLLQKVGQISINNSQKQIHDDPELASATQKLRDAENKRDDIQEFVQQVTRLFGMMQKTAEQVQKERKKFDKLLHIEASQTIREIFNEYIQTNNLSELKKKLKETRGFYISRGLEEKMFDSILAQVHKEYLKNPELRIRFQNAAFALNTLLEERAIERELTGVLVYEGNVMSKARAFSQESTRNPSRSHSIVI